MSGRQGLMWQAAARGNIRLRDCELREYARLKEFIRDNPGCTQLMIRKQINNRRVGMFLAYGTQIGDLRGDLETPERWWLA